MFLQLFLIFRESFCTAHTFCNLSEQSISQMVLQNEFPLSFEDFLLQTMESIVLQLASGTKELTFQWRTPKLLAYVASSNKELPSSIWCSRSNIFQHWHQTNISAPNNGGIRNGISVCMGSLFGAEAEALFLSWVHIFKRWGTEFNGQKNSAKHTLRAPMQGSDLEQQPIDFGCTASQWLH